MWSGALDHRSDFASLGLFANEARTLVPSVDRVLALKATEKPRRASGAAFLIPRLKAEPLGQLAAFEIMPSSARIIISKKFTKRAMRDYCW
jgi:hypothetical protein